MALDDEQPLSGAQFARQVGADPEKWAERFLDAAAEVTDRTTAERIAFTAAWFRGAMEAAVKTAHRRALREDDELRKVGIWKPGDSTSMDGDAPFDTRTPDGRPR